MVGSVARMIETDRRAVTFTSTKRRARKPRVAVTTIATVTVCSPGSRAALRTAQSLGRALRCELGEGGQLHIWTEEAKP